MSNTTPMPPVVSEEEWRAARVEFLTKEKELTKRQDQLNAERRRLPMVKVEKEYCFDGPDGKRSLRDLFEDQTQLIVYHFMFGPDWEKGCSGCTGYIDALGDLSDLKKRNTSFVVVSRAPLAKLEAYKAEHGWNIPWYSSLGSDFNYDFHVSFDPAKLPVEYNYRSLEDWQKVHGEAYNIDDELPGTSVFFRDGDDIYHTYSSFARGGEYLTSTSTLLDITPYGRQEEWEDSPPGWPQKPTYG